MRLLVVAGEEDTPALLKSLLRGRIERPYSIEAIAEVPASGHASYDVLILEFACDADGIERRIIAEIRRAVGYGGTPPLVLLGGARNRALEPILLTAGAADFIWKEEISAPLLECQVRHAMEARHHAVLGRQFHETQKLETIGRLAGGVAHDFNNILTSIVGFGSLLQEEVRGDRDAEANIDEILQAAERASVLTRQLLAFGRRQVLHPVRVHLDETIDGVTSLINRLIGDDIRLALTITPSLPPVRADRAQIESALLNLVMHARDAMPHGGQLSIELREVSVDEDYCATHLDVVPGHYVQLSVGDSGDGIPEHAREQIFEPFAVPGRRGPGSGLGLAAVYGMVKQSGGHILVHSVVGRGTTFDLFLPIDESVEAALEEPAGEKKTSEPQETILLVEDADGIRRLAGEVIRRAGYRVIEAAGPAEAEAAIDAYDGEVNLLLTDILMPGGNGVELAGRLTTAYPRLNVLFMSGYTDDPALRSGVLSGEAAFIQKPFTPQELLRKVKQVLQVGV